MVKGKKIRMTARVWSSGGNLVITIGKAYAEKAGLKKGDLIIVEFERME